MVKKKYLFAFLLVSIIVIFTTYQTYGTNYRQYLKETKATLGNFSDAAFHQYDNVFFEISSAMKNYMDKLESVDSQDKEIRDLAHEISDESHYIKSVNVVIKKGEKFDYQTKNFDNQNNIWIDQREDLYKFLGKYIDTGLKDRYSILGIIQTEKEGSSTVTTVNKFKTKDGYDGYILSSIDYERINRQVNPESYSVYGGYVFLLSDNGTFLYHIEPGLIGKNLFMDSKEIMDITRISETDYGRILGIVSDKSRKMQKKLFEYEAYGFEKISFYNYLNEFPGVIFLSVNYSMIKEMQMKSILRTLLPLFFCLLIAAIVLLKYIYLIKYTDYFTEIKNELYFKKRLKKLKYRGAQSRKLVLLKIDNLLKTTDEDYIDDDKIFYCVSNYFKTLKGYYKNMYRFSRVHYVFTLEESFEDKIPILLSKLSSKISAGTIGDVFLKGRVMFVDLDNISELNPFDVGTNIMSFMESRSSRLGEKFEGKYVCYSEICAKKQKRQANKLLIEKSIKNSELVPFFQPIIDLKTGKLTKYEVLLRIKDNDEYILPSEFLSVAEKEGVIQSIDSMIVQKSFAYYDKTSRNTCVHLNLNINLSTQSINRTMVDFIVEKAKTYNVKPKNITFELMETGAIDGMESKFALIQELRSNGFKIAIDHFGSGYAHVELLSKLDVDYVKIDLQFIENVGINAQSIKTINALVYLAKNYDCKIIAESVENRKCLQVLNKLEMDYAQGFYFGKPKKDITTNTNKWVLNPGIFK